MLLIPSGKTVPCLKRGPNQRRSVLRIVGQGITSRCIWITPSSRALRFARRWDAARSRNTYGHFAVHRKLVRTRQCPFLDGGLNWSTQRFILEGKDGVWDGTKIS